MGIPKLERALWSMDGCVFDVSIPELVEKYGRNVVVVDGFNFYGLYLYPRFDWVCGAFQELIQEIRTFVEAFERVGVKLVFFFVDGNLDEGADSCGSESWIERHCDFTEYTQRCFNVLTASSKKIRSSVNEGRNYYHTPMNALPVVLFALRHIFDCAVHLVYAGDRCDAIAYYSKNNDCLAVIAQDNYYIFYRCVPRYLSLKNLNLKNMTTVQYCPKALAKHTNLVGFLYPIFLKNQSLTPQEKEMLFEVDKKLEECENIDVARKKITECLNGKKINEVLDLVSIDIKKDVSFLFLVEILRYNIGFDYLTVYGPLKKWELIKLRSQELYASGQMSMRIQQILMSKKYYNENILEDFTELPPSSLVFQSLRAKLYGVLLHEAPTSDNIERSETDESNATESSNIQLQPGALHVWQKKLYEVALHGEPHKHKVILEWLILKNGCTNKPIFFIPERIDSALHPGLLKLWDFNNETLEVRDKKWKLFSYCISENLDWQLLRSLPTKLVVPTVVLYYLFQVAPPMFETRSWKFLQSWEIEVFIAQAVMLSKLSAESLSKIFIKDFNPRVVNLMAFFVYGCHHVRLIIEACGYPISKVDLCLLNFFDGKLFHSFYEQASWRRSATSLCDTQSYTVFQQMKHIIVPDAHSSSRRM